ncbi:hypothetical protein GCM10009087_52110 [Sphingomonas oligophenolica]|uniref:Uncharacterized protein n=1 Tax=Sphingomonas oligophenolica TaxID=301154 RepID=A0ABU9Y6Z5_9SPHN
MRFAQTGWVALAFLLSAGATICYLVVWPRATFLECWNGYAEIPLEEQGPQWGDLKGCRETSVAEAKKGNVKGAELAAFLYSGTDDTKNVAFFTVERSN